jgi:hypothetical protein
MRIEVRDKRLDEQNAAAAARRAVKKKRRATRLEKQAEKKSNK